MANIKWTGIEQKKYGLTARWYVSAFYGNDVDVDAVGLYDPSTNPTGHGGKERPFASLDAQTQLGGTGVTVVDSGNYAGALTPPNSPLIGDGTVVISQMPFSLGKVYYNVNILAASALSTRGFIVDGTCLYSSVGTRDAVIMRRALFIECSFSFQVDRGTEFRNCIFVRCAGTLGLSAINKGHANNFFINCENMTIDLIKPRPTGNFVDYSVIIGAVRTSTAINGKTIGVTVEDFKADGNYFGKSYSEVDLFGNASGSGATTAQINEIFNNYYSPIYIDDWQNADFTLRPDADDRIKFGGLNGTYIGAKPVGHRFSAYDLWNTHIDSGNTSGLQWDSVNNAIVLGDLEDVGTYRSVRVSMSKPITVDLVAFFANFVYNIEGTAKQGVANQRIDTTPDLQPDNTENQRVVYDYRLQVAPDTVTALSSFKNYELNRTPTVDGDGYSQLDDLFNSATEQKQLVQDFIIEFTLRRVIID